MVAQEAAEGDWLDLADALELLRNQIGEAQRRLGDADEKAVRFGLGDVTVEFGMELVRTVGVDGGLRFSVVSVGGKRDTGRTATHTVTVILHPHAPGGGDVDVSDEEDA
jgi:hypothetical protein